MKAGFLASIFIVIAAIGFFSSATIFYSMWLAQESSPEFIIRGILYFFSSLALVVIARRDFKRQRARQNAKDEL
jgi:hypothetical protein